MDRISQCSEGVLVTFLSGMKARELLRTRVISRHWHDFWKKVPTLIFDLEDFNGVDNDNERFRHPEFKEGITKFGRLVQYCISNRDDSVDTSKIVLKYHIISYEGLIYFTELIKTVINYCTNHNPKTFYMDIETNIFSINIPDSFSTCQSIEEVRFFLYDTSGDHIFRPRTVHMSNLRKIHFKFVSFTDSKMKVFLSGTANPKILTLENCVLEMDGIFCENLESLDLLSLAIKTQNELDAFTIFAPQLEILRTEGEIDAQFMLTNTPKIEKSIMKSTFNDGDSDFLNSLSSVFELEICFDGNLVDIIKCAPNVATVPNLTMLTLTDQTCLLCYFDEIRDFIINSCNNLEELNLFQLDCERDHALFYCLPGFEEEDGLLQSLLLPHTENCESPLF